MAKFVSDQAEGLRRLLARHGSRAIAVTGGSAGVGGSTAVVNLAAALAAQGKDVLVVDEHAGDPRSIAALTGGASPERFAAFSRGEVALEAAVARHAAGFAVLGVPHGARAACKPSQLAAVFDGANITLLAVTGLTHRQAYADIFAITLIKTLAVFVVIAVYHLTGLV